MDFQEFINSLRAISIADLLSPTELSIWRQYCRIYSKTFHTPLHLVLDMDPEVVIRSVLEDNLEGADLDEHTEELLERIYAIEDPNYEIMKKKELDEVDKKIEAEEEERLRSGKPIHPSLASVMPENSLLEKVQREDKKIPPSGGINLSYLEKEDSEGGGF